MSDIYNSRFAGLIGKINGQERYAVTTSKNTTRYSCIPEAVGAAWRKHEECHKKQIAEEGWLKFMAKYFFFNITRGYKNNPYEIAARLAETQP
jgi:hypothetical protein